MSTSTSRVIERRPPGPGHAADRRGRRSSSSRSARELALQADSVEDGARRRAPATPRRRGSSRRCTTSLGPRRRAEGFATSPRAERGRMLGSSADPARSRSIAAPGAASRSWAERLGAIDVLAADHLAGAQALEPAVLAPTRPSSATHLVAAAFAATDRDARSSATPPEAPATSTVPASASPARPLLELVQRQRAGRTPPARRSSRPGRRARRGGTTAAGRGTRACSAPAAATGDAQVVSLSDEDLVARRRLVAGGAPGQVPARGPDAGARAPGRIRPRRALGHRAARRRPRS